MMAETNFRNNDTNKFQKQWQKQKFQKQRQKQIYKTNHMAETNFRNN